MNIHHLSENNGVTTTRIRKTVPVQVETILEPTIGAGDVIQLIGCLPGIQEAQGSVPRSTQLRLGGGTFIIPALSGGRRRRRIRIQGQPQLYKTLRIAWATRTVSHTKIHPSGENLGMVTEKVKMYP